MTEIASIAHVRKIETAIWSDPLFRLDWLEDMSRARNFPCRVWRRRVE